MIYEPENLKKKRAMYEKKDKWLIRLAFLFWAVLLFIYVNIVIPYVKSTIGFLGIIVGGIAVITIVYFFIMFFVLMRRGYQFRKMNNDIVREYQENKNGELFLEKLLAMDMKPKDMQDEMTWYLNIATAFNVLGKRNESIALFKFGIERCQYADTHTNPGQSGDASDIRQPRFGAQTTAHSRSLAGRAGWIIHANGHQNAAYG